MSVIKIFQVYLSVLQYYIAYIKLNKYTVDDILSNLCNQYAEGDIITAIEELEMYPIKNITKPCLKLRGVSMLPMLKPDDLIKIECVLSSELRFGDIITFYRDNALITHRYLGKSKYNGRLYAIEKGDNSFFNYVYEDHIIGRVTSITRNNVEIPISSSIDKFGGYFTAILSFLYWGIFFVLLLGIPLIVIAAYNSFNVNKAYLKIVRYYLNKKPNKIWFLKSNFFLYKLTGIIPALILCYKIHLKLFRNETSKRK